MPAPINTSNGVLPPYNSVMDPISDVSRGTYNASDYGERWISPPGSLLPRGMIGGKRRTRRHKKKVRFTKKRKPTTNKKRRGRKTRGKR